MTDQNHCCWWTTQKPASCNRIKRMHPCISYSYNAARQKACFSFHDALADLRIWATVGLFRSASYTQRGRGFENVISQIFLSVLFRELKKNHARFHAGSTQTSRRSTRGRLASADTWRHSAVRRSACQCTMLKARASKLWSVPEPWSICVTLCVQCGQYLSKDVSLFSVRDGSTGCFVVSTVHIFCPLPRAKTSRHPMHGESRIAQAQPQVPLATNSRRLRIPGKICSGSGRTPTSMSTKKQRFEDTLQPRLVATENFLAGARVE